MKVSISQRLYFMPVSLLCAGKPVMIVIEYMENGSLDAFLRVSITFQITGAQSSISANFFPVHLLERVPDSRQSAAAERGEEDQCMA